MFGDIKILLAEMDAEGIGRVIGGLLVPTLIILFGVTKCHTISLRPSTNRNCARALMYALLALSGSYLLGAVTKLLSATAYFRSVNILGLLVVLGLAVTALVLGRRGLAEYARQPGQYNQGRAQARWALAISILLILLAGGGFVWGLTNSSVQSKIKLLAGKPGQELKFDEYNFRFRAPEHPWVSVDVAALNKDSKVAFMRRLPEAYFLIIPEALNDTMTSAQLAELGKANLRSVASSSRMISEAPFQVNHQPGILVEHEAQLRNLRLFYMQWYLATNGYAYQLMGYGKAEDRQKIEGELKEMLTRFELIDPNRQAALQRPGFTTNFISPAHGYTVNVANSKWRPFTSLKEDFSEAEFGGTMGDSCFAVVPVWLGAVTNMDLDALAAGLLGTMNIAYPDNDFTHREVQREAGSEQLQFDYQRTLDKDLYRYRIKIIHTGEFGYLAVAWTMLNEENADAVLNDALGRIVITAPKGTAWKSLLKFGGQDYKNQAYVLNQAGLFFFNSQEYERALPMLQASVAAESTNTVHINNLLLTWSRLNRPKDGLEFLGAQPEEMQAKPGMLAFKAFFQAKCSQVDEAITNYSKVFSTGYRDEADFQDYVELLINAGQYDQALAQVGRYLAAGDSLSVRLLTADIYRNQQAYTRAVEFLQAEHDKAPYNSRITRRLINALLDAERPNEALACSQELLKTSKDSYLSYYLKARCEMDLKWYREAKVSLEAAAKLEPANEDVKASLNYVSGRLGEGNNSMLKDPIPPVPLPAAATNQLPATPAKDFARDYGAYYIQHIKALDCVTNAESRTTDYLRIQVLDAAGVTAFSTYQMSFDPLSYDIFVNEAKVLGAAGKVITTIQASDCYVIDEAQTDGKASQRKTLNIPIAGLQPGCELSLIITRRSLGRYDEFPFLRQTFSRPYPVLHSGVFLQGSGAGLRMRATPDVQRVDLPEGIFWSVTNPLVASWEPLQPAGDTYLPMLWLADGRAQWERLATNYLADIHDRLQADERVKRLALTLTDGLTGNPAKLAAVCRFVQTNCTYKAIEFGRHSRIPQTAANTLRNAYGDCKDHAVLLQQLLQGAGIPASLALISSEDSVQTDLPSLDQFDHMIVAVELDQAERFVDPTDKGSELALGQPAGLAEQQALVLNPTHPHLARLAPYADDASLIKVQQEVTLTGTADLTLAETVSLTGVHATYLRGYLLGLSPAYRQEYLQREMAGADASMSNCEIVALDDPSQPLQIKCSLAFKRRFHTVQNGLMGALHSGLERFYLSVPAMNNRTAPFEITVPLRIESHVVFTIPKGYRVVEKPAPAGKPDGRFITFQSQPQLEPGKLNLSFQFQRRAGRHAAADYAAYRESLEQVLSSLEHEIELRAD